MDRRTEEGVELGGCTDGKDGWHDGEALDGQIRVDMTKRAWRHE